MSDRPFGPGIIPPGADVSSLWDSVASALSSARERGEQVGDDALEGLNEIIHLGRYGMGSADLRNRINEGSAPGATPNPGLGIEDREARRAAAYYFARKWPTVAPLVQRPINALRDARTLLGVARNPFADEGTPEQRQELYRVANEASRRGSSDEYAAFNRYAAQDSDVIPGSADYQPDDTRYASVEDE